MTAHDNGSRPGAHRINPEGETQPIPAARAHQLSKKYGSGDTEVIALDAVDVMFERGKFTAILLW